MPVSSALHDRDAVDPATAATAGDSDSDSDSSSSSNSSDFTAAPMPIASAPASASDDAATTPSDTPPATTADSDAPAVRYSVDLLQSFPEVCQKAKSGVQTCHAVAAFVQERANMEVTYSKALLRIAQYVSTSTRASRTRLHEQR